MVLSVDVEEGDFVRKDEPLVTLKTDLTNIKIPARSGGLVKAIMVGRGQTVKVGDLLMIVDHHMDFDLPGLGEGIEEAEVTSVMIEKDSHIQIDQIIMEVLTDKAVIEIPSPIAGFVRYVHVKAGQIISVGQVLVSFSSELDDETLQHYLDAHNIRIGLRHLARLNRNHLTERSALGEFHFEEMADFLKDISELAKEYIAIPLYLLSQQQRDRLRDGLHLVLEHVKDLQRFDPSKSGTRITAHEQILKSYNDSARIHLEAFKQRFSKVM